jgi:hypothetical protein
MLGNYPMNARSIIERGNASPPEAENLVEFHLLYSGPLHSAGYERQRAEKHAIRKIFHSQLRRLWETQPNLRRMAEIEGAHYYADEIQEAIRKGSTPPDAVLSDDESRQKGFVSLASNWNRNGFNFLPLVTAKFCLRCCLDVLFLRVEEKDYVLQGGDVDGRIKILFDALRLVRSKDELPTGAQPESGEDPFFCLLQDDELISEVRINTGQLLHLPDARELDKHDVYLQIAIRLNPTQLTQYSWAF